MGGQTMEYVLTHPEHKVRALILASTSGSIHKPSVPLPDPQRLAEWNRKAAAARADMARRGIAPPAGERMAREQPALHFLYRELDALSQDLDKTGIRKKLIAMRTTPRAGSPRWRQSTQCRSDHSSHHRSASASPGHGPEWPGS